MGLLLRELAPGAGLVVLTARPTMASALEALRLGAYAFFSRPQSTAVLAAAIGAARNLRLLLAGLKDAPVRSTTRSGNDDQPESPEPLPALAV